MEPQKKAVLTTWVVLLLSFAPAIGVVVYIARHEAAVEKVIQEMGAAGPLVSILLYCILGVSPIPGDPLLLIIGAVYGPIWGALVAWIGMTLAALVEYFIGTRIGDAAALKLRREDLPFGLGNLPVDSILFLLVGRLLTSTGAKFVSYLSGIYRVSLWRFVWTTAVSNLFGAFLFALGGTGLLKLF